MSCVFHVFHAFVSVQYSLLPCGHLLGKAFWLLFAMFNCVFVTFPSGILGQVWYLIVFLIFSVCLTLAHWRYQNELCDTKSQLFKHLEQFLCKTDKNYTFCLGSNVHALSLRSIVSLLY